MVMPSRASASSTTAAHSGSSRPSGCAISRAVASEPRRRTGRDHETAGLDLELGLLLGADHHRLVVSKARIALDHANAEAGEALLGIVRRNRINDPMDVIVDCSKID